MTLSISSRTAATQVRWAAGKSPVSNRIRFTVVWVRSRVEPPAPYVTETKLGCSGASRVIDSQSVRSISSVFGGKNSKETRMRRSSGACTNRLARGPGGKELVISDEWLKRYWL